MIRNDDAPRATIVLSMLLLLLAVTLTAEAQDGKIFNPQTWFPMLFLSAILTFPVLVFGRSPAGSSIAPAAASRRRPPLRGTWPSICRMSSR